MVAKATRSSVLMVRVPRCRKAKHGSDITLHYERQSLEAHGPRDSRNFCGVTSGKNNSSLIRTSHLMTRSAFISTLWGMFRPVLFAVFRFITKSNLLGCSIGKSPGFAPFRILAHRVIEWVDFSDKQLRLPVRPATNRLRIFRKPAW